MSIQHSPQTTPRPLQTGAPDERLPVVRPAVDLFESDENLLIVAEVPGARADDLSVKLDRQVLLIEAIGSFATGDGAMTACEVAPVRYRRAFDLRADIDADGITASLKDGLLSVTLPRAAAARPRRIDVIEA